MLKRFCRDSGGIASVEFVIVAPFLIFLIFGSVTLFGMYRGSQIAEKATFTVGDLISRQTEVSNSFLDKTKQTFDRIAPTSATAKTFRVTSVKKTNGRLSVAWSYATSPLQKLTTATIPTSRLPDLADGDSVVLTESFVPYVPLFAIANFVGGQYESLAANRPRFTSAIAKTD